MAGDLYTFERRRGISRIGTTLPPNPRSWKSYFYCIEDRCIPPNKQWRAIDKVVRDVIPSESEYKPIYLEHLVSVSALFVSSRDHPLTFSDQ
jgi:hypothetical protein